LFLAYPWAPDTFRWRICLCDHSLHARADGSDWSDCVENDAPTVWNSSLRHYYYPYGSSARRPDL
jgi:hypothetical protein